MGRAQGRPPPSAARKGENEPEGSEEDRWKESAGFMVAVDFSPYSEQVVRFAAGLARSLEAELVVLNVLNQRDVDAVEMVARDHPSISVADFIQRSKNERSALLGRQVADAAIPLAAAKTLVRVGVPYKEILKTLVSEQADLLVMGSKGRGNIVDALFGSTAEKVFRRCPVPLVSVRPAGHPHPAS